MSTQQRETVHTLTRGDSVSGFGTLEFLKSHHAKHGRAALQRDWVAPRSEAEGVACVRVAACRGEAPGLEVAVSERHPKGAREGVPARTRPTFKL